LAQDLASSIAWHKIEPEEEIYMHTGECARKTEASLIMCIEKRITMDKDLKYSQITVNLNGKYIGIKKTGTSKKILRNHYPMFANIKYRPYK